jgi:hypothetical protein
MISFFQDTIHYFFDLEYYLSHYSDERSRLTEFFSITFGSLAISISSFYLSPPYQSGFLLVLLTSTAFTYILFYVLNRTISSLVDYSFRRIHKIGDTLLLNHSFNFGIMIFLLSIPLSIICVKLSLIKLTGVILVFFPLKLVYLYLMIRTCSFIYRVHFYTALVTIFRQYIFLVLIVFVFLFYVIMQIGYLAK